MVDKDTMQPQNVESRVSEFVKKETCSPFKAHKLYLNQKEKEEKMR